MSSFSDWLEEAKKRKLGIENHFDVDVPRDVEQLWSSGLLVYEKIVIPAKDLYPNDDNLATYFFSMAKIAAFFDEYKNTGPELLKDMERAGDSVNL